MQEPFYEFLVKDLADDFLKCATLDARYDNVTTTRLTVLRNTILDAPTRLTACPAGV